MSAEGPKCNLMCFRNYGRFVQYLSDKGFSGTQADVGGVQKRVWTKICADASEMKACIATMLVDMEYPDTILSTHMTPDDENIVKLCHVVDTAGIL